MDEKDKLKDFVLEHKAALEQQTPSARVWESIRTKLPDQKSRESHYKVSKRSLGVQIWWTAASLLLFAAAALWFWPETEPYPQPTALEEKLALLEENMKANPIQSDQKTRNDQPIQQVMPIEQAQPSAPAEPRGPAADAKAETWVAHEESSGIEALSDIEELSGIEKLSSVFALLHDSLSASNRLEGVLRLAALPAWSDEEMIQLSQSLNHDPSTNVRLAALEALTQRMPLEDGANLLQEYLIQQDDPFIQIELLMAMLMDDELHLQKATKERLINLAEDPMSFDFVQEQAYAVLMKIN